jgi:hypothetical protein
MPLMRAIKKYTATYILLIRSETDINVNRLAVREWQAGFYLPPLYNFPLQVI